MRISSYTPVRPVLLPEVTPARRGGGRAAAPRADWARLPGGAKAMPRPPTAQGALAKRAAAQTAAAKARAETAANKGYGGAFVMMDLTDTAAHALRLAAMADIADAHAEAKLGGQGAGILFPDAFVDATESHISVIRGISAPLLHPDTVQGGGERPAMGHLDAFDSLRGTPAPTLSLAPKVVYWEGPAVGPKQYRVVALEIVDRAGTLKAMQQGWAQAGGTLVPSHVALHLTLAYLRLDAPALPDPVAQRIALRVAQAGAWQQTEVTYSGRYGATFGRATLPEK